MSKRKLLSASVVLALGVGMSGSAWAHGGNATLVVTTTFDPVSPVVAGTMVDVIGTALCPVINFDDGFCDASSKQLVGGTVHLDRLQLDADDTPVACGTPDSSFAAWNDGPAVAGEYSAPFDTTGFAGETIGFRTHYVGNGVSHVGGNNFSDCEDLEVTAADDPFPDGATSFSQGHYGSSQGGEALVDDIINGALTVTPEALCEEINMILGDVGEGLTLDCSSADDREDILAFFLTGPVGPGPEGDDDGFLPAGNQGGIKNLAAQKITLLLNLELAAVLMGDPLPIPMESGWFLNIDPVQDLVDGVPGAIIDPVLTTEPKLCVDVVDDDDLCEDVEVLNDLGLLLQALDDRPSGTTIQEVLDAADAVLADTNHDPVDIGTVMDITADELTKLLGCINEAFDGMITGVVTAFDADPAP